MRLLPVLLVVLVLAGRGVPQARVPASPGEDTVLVPSPDPKVIRREARPPVIVLGSTGGEQEAVTAVARGDDVTLVFT